MNRKKFKLFLQEIEKEGIKEPIKYVEFKGEKYVVDGHHRLRAARILNLDAIPIERVTLPYKSYKTESDLLGYFGP